MPPKKSTQKASFSPMDLVRHKDSLSDFVKVKHLIVDLTACIQDIPDYEELRLTMQLTKYICNCVESEVLNSDKKCDKLIDKKALVATVLDNVYQFNDEEKLIVSDQIQFLYDTKSIHQIGYMRYLMSFFTSEMGAPKRVVERPRALDVVQPNQPTKQRSGYSPVDNSDEEVDALMQSIEQTTQVRIRQIMEKINVKMLKETDEVDVVASPKKGVKSPAKQDFKVKSNICLAKTPHSDVMQRKHLPIHIRKATLTTSHDLRPLFVSKNVPVYNQLDTSSCTANAGACLYQFVFPDTQPSRMFLYYNERICQHDTAHDSGAKVGDVFNVLSNIGVCDESFCIYNDGKSFAEVPSTAAFENAKKHRIHKYATVKQELISIKTELLHSNPIIIAIKLFDSFYTDEVTNTGMVPVPKSGENYVSGHCVLLVGFDDDKQLFTERNSWGSDWGDAGHFYVPYEYLLDTSLTSDLWVLPEEGNVEKCR
jgi:C1A family cysteine protease